MQEYANANIHKDWIGRGEHMREVHGNLTEEVGLQARGYFQKAKDTSSNADSIGFESMIAKPELVKYDPRRIFPEMLDQIHGT